jgi:adenine-specific DNA-methyltransferase
MPILQWLTREEDVRAASRVPYRLLEEAPELSAGDRDVGNMLIQGDNLEALKALLPFYAGRVKCIYIDPPYNTRSAFEHYDDNLEHTQWLAMMWPRLELLRDLLAEDGSIWVSIDDNEGHYLKVIMDEVFGRSNYGAPASGTTRTSLRSACGRPRRRSPVRSWTPGWRSPMERRRAKVWPRSRRPKRRADSGLRSIRRPRPR